MAEPPAPAHDPTLGADAAAAKPRRELRNVIVFTVAGRRYALELRWVREVVRLGFDRDGGITRRLHESFAQDEDCFRRHCGWRDPWSAELRGAENHLGQCTSGRRDLVFVHELGERRRVGHPRVALGAGLQQHANKAGPPPGVIRLMRKKARDREHAAIDLPARDRMVHVGTFFEIADDLETRAEKLLKQLG